MATTLTLPRLCTELRILRDTEVARGEFRRRRLDDPLAEYRLKFPQSKAAADQVIDALDELISRPTDRLLLADFVSRKPTYAALRSLAATPISSDDLNTLLRASVNRRSIGSNQALADSLAELLETSLDPERFRWIGQSRLPTATELQAAQLATAVLTAVSAVQAARRGNESKELEGKVAGLLEEAGFVQVVKPSAGIQTLAQFPLPGHFMRCCKLGGHNADLVVRLFDGRLLAVECKASNSEVNGYKRLNKEVVVDAADWYRNFGRSNIVVAAALRGVFKSANVSSAQTHGVYLFWWHRMGTLNQFLSTAR